MRRRSRLERYLRLQAGLHGPLRYRESEPHRQTFIDTVQSIYDREGIQRRFADEWPTIFFNKSCAGNGTPTRSPSSRRLGLKPDIVNLKVYGSPRLDRSFLALSHPVRRGILQRLALGPATAGEVAAGFPISKPAITKHLKLLEEAGVLRRQVEGRTHRLTLDERPLDEAVQWLERHRAVREAKFDTVEQYLAGSSEAP